jgi:4-hydroxybenzoate polyprenyltransferase
VILVHGEAVRKLQPSRSKSNSPREHARLLSKILNVSALKALFHSDMQACFLTIFYLILVSGAKVLSYDFLWKILSIIASLALYIVYMFFVNDYFDMPTDKIAGKKREIHDMPEVLVVGLLVLVTLMSWVVTVLLVGQTLYILVYAVAYFLATFYSAPPLRLKCRGLLGTISADLIEKPIPAVLVFSFFQYFRIDALILVAFFFVWQLEMITHHQYLDYEGDLHAQVKTYAVEIGPERTVRMLDYLQLVVTVSSFVVFCLIFVSALGLQYAGIFLIFMTAGLVLVYKLRRSRDSVRDKSVLPSRYFVKDTATHPYYAFIDVCLQWPLPLWVGLVSTLRFPPYILVLLLTIGSQYYFVKGYYRPVFRGALSLFQRIHSA